MDDDERRQALNSVLLRGGLLLVGIAVAVALGTYLFVHALGLNQAADSSRPVTAKPATPLPSTALPVPGSDSPSPSPSDSGAGQGDHRGGTGQDSGGHASHRPSRKHHHQSAHALQLSASPAVAAPMQRVNLTGRYPGQDSVALQVQRLENGTWSDFPVQASVTMGTFQTYVETGRSGVNRFRVYDPSSGRASNVVSVTIQ